MNSKFLGVLVVVLLVIIIGLLVVLVVVPGPHAASVPPAQSATSTTPIETTPPPLSKNVSIFAPASGASVEQTFDVAGIAPNAWYFEAVFPIQVRDPEDNVIARGQGQAQSDWTTPGPVPFKATITLNAPYHGSATLILMKDNPSGLPENDDSVTLPIVIK